MGDGRMDGDGWGWMDVRILLSSRYLSLPLFNVQHHVRKIDQLPEVNKNPLHHWTSAIKNRSQCS